jgi:hypothetical protein
LYTIALGNTVLVGYLYLVELEHGLIEETFGYENNEHVKYNLLNHISDT